MSLPTFKPVKLRDVKGLIDQIASTKQSSQQMINRLSGHEELSDCWGRVQWHRGFVYACELIEEWIDSRMDKKPKRRENDSPYFGRGGV